VEEGSGLGAQLVEMLTLVGTRVGWFLSRRCEKYSFALCSVRHLLEVCCEFYLPCQDRIHLEKELIVVHN
jgi:hypothetical protein